MRCLSVVFSVVMPPDRFLGPFRLQVPDLAEEFADAGALVEDLGVGAGTAVFGVERALAPGRLDLFVLGDGGGSLPSPGISGGGGESRAGLGVGVEERAGHVGTARDGGNRWHAC